MSQVIRNTFAVAVTVIPPADAAAVIGPNVWAFGWSTHIHTGIPTRPMLSGPGSGTIPMSIAERSICLTAISATSRGDGPAPEPGGELAAHIVIAIPVCGWKQS